MRVYKEAQPLSVLMNLIQSQQLSFRNIINQNALSFVHATMSAKSTQKTFIIITLISDHLALVIPWLFHVAVRTFVMTKHEITLQLINRHKVIKSYIYS